MLWLASFLPWNPEVRLRSQVTGTQYCQPTPKVDHFPVERDMALVYTSNLWNGPWTDSCIGLNSDSYWRSDHSNCSSSEVVCILCLLFYSKCMWCCMVICLMPTFLSYLSCEWDDWSANWPNWELDYTKNDILKIIRILSTVSPDDLRRVAGVAVPIYTPMIASLGRRRVDKANRDTTEGISPCVASNKSMRRVSTLLGSLDIPPHSLRIR